MSTQGGLGGGDRDTRLGRDLHISPVVGPEECQVAVIDDRGEVAIAHWHNADASTDVDLDQVAVVVHGDSRRCRQLILSMSSATEFLLQVLLKPLPNRPFQRYQAG